MGGSQEDGRAGDAGEGPSGRGGSAGSGGKAGALSDGGVSNVAGAGQGGADAGAAGSESTCSAGKLRCNAYQPQRCKEGTWVDEGDECTGWCQGGTCLDAPSCGPQSSTTPCVGGTSCCDTIWVPGGAYQMGKGDEEDPDLTYARKVRGFYLDRFEVTVGRFITFKQKYKLPSAGDGASPHIPMSGWDEKWETVPDTDHPGETAVPPTSEALVLQVGDPDHCSASTWNTTENTRPINCVNWYVAFAFCAFDGGRLPTEAEWNYAAAFGDAHRPYPWSQSPADVTVNPTYATYFEYPVLLELPDPVGNHPTGQGGFHRHALQGHEDLAGNLLEWTADRWFDSPPSSCGPDCMAPWADDDDQRVVRGGAFSLNSYYLRTGQRSPMPAFNVTPNAGLRCARDADF
jgi:sulfatase modifying factor 1